MSLELVGMSGLDAGSESVASTCDLCFGEVFKIMRDVGGSVF